MEEKIISLEKYLEGVKPIPDRQAPEDSSWIVKAWYKANTKDLPGPYSGKNVVVQGILEDFRFGRIIASVYVKIKGQNGTKIEFAKLFCSSELENPSQEYYRDLLKDLKGRDIIFVANSYPGQWWGIHHFIEGIYIGSELKQF
jgi:hypothetical protein